MGENKFKIIEKNSTLEGIAKGDLVEVVGIATSSQKQKGLVVYSDSKPPRASLILVRASQDLLLLKTYFVAPYIYKEKEIVYESTHQKFFNKGVDEDFRAYDQKLKEVGL